jgi:hypothetical protein
LAACIVGRDLDVVFAIMNPATGGIQDRVAVYGTARFANRASNHNGRRSNDGMSGIEPGQPVVGTKELSIRQFDCFNAR